MLRMMTLMLLLLCGSLVQAMQVDLQMTDMEGNTLRLSDYRGKWVVLNYWATWCPPCLEEIPELVHFHENHKEKTAVVIGVDMERLPPKVLASFVEENFITYPVIPLVENMQAFDDVTSFPTTYLIDPAGNAVVKHVGAVTAEAIEEFIKSYVPDKTAVR